MDSATSVRTQLSRFLTVGIASLCFAFNSPTNACAQTNDQPVANWVWSAERPDGKSPAGICYFRKTFVVPEKNSGWIDIACDSQYTLFANGVKVAAGSGPEALNRHSLTPYLRPGRNVIAVEAMKNRAGPAGMLATISLQGQRDAVFHMVTNETWKTKLQTLDNWQQSEFLDSNWQPAKVLAAADEGRIWKVPLAARDDRPRGGGQANTRTGEKNRNPNRFRVSNEFRVEWIAAPEETGSLIAMAFDEFGNIIASREGGPLLLIRDMDRDGITETVTTYCDQVESCQGILAMNGQVLVTGNGPRGSGLYRLSDDDRNGVIDHIDLVVPFPGTMQEHGPHAIQLGPDGMIYLLLGNLTQLDTDFSPESPYRHFYEGDLVTPRYEDPRGHANSGKAPGGVVLRIDPTGNRIERFAGGLRNPYDMAFNAEGDLFTWDADMEWDQGSTWYRPTRGNHLIPGAEFGWRSGWAKWPTYFIDSLPAFAETGNGSPTGMTVYNHFMFPARYHGALFVGDWAQGRILDVRLKRQGASYTGEVRVFLEGNPLNVTDMEIGPDGMLYFCTGGRGTEGGVYRVGWTGRVPPQVRDLGTGIEVALRQPQLQTAWARQQIALVKEELGEGWEQDLLEILLDPTANELYRERAVDLLQLYGPQPTTELLVQLSRDRNRRIRTKVAYFLGLQSNPQSAARLGELLDDPNVVVKRVACESLARLNSENVPVEKLVDLLGHGDRHLNWSAAKALQNVPLESWKDQIIESEQQRVFLIGSAAILGTAPEKEVCLDVLEAVEGWLDSFVADREFVDLLRVVQLALMQGNIEATEIPELSRQIASEFPSGNTVINRELVRLLAYLESPLVATRYLEYLKSDLPLEERTHLLTHAPFLTKSWTPAEQFEILQKIATVQEESTSESHTRYLDEAARRLVARMDAKQQQLVLDRGAEWPGAALGAIAYLPKHPSDDLLAKLMRLDQALVDKESEAVARLRIGIAAVLARSGRDKEMVYLRELFDNEPERRDILAVALAQQASGANWPLLIDSLPLLDDGYAVAVMAKLNRATETCEDPQALRQVILLGLRQNQDMGRKLALALLQKWSGENPGEAEEQNAQKLTAWQDWFRAEYPDLPDPVLPQDSELDRYTFDELEQYLESDDALVASPESGRIVYAKADCIKCHRFGEIGGGVGPDLTSVGKRFRKKELLQSIVYPSHFISDQYATKTVATAGGKTLNGVVKENNDGSVLILDPEGNRITVAAADIDEIVPNKKSTMPAGLLNELSLEEIASLFAFLNEKQTPTVSRRIDRSVGQ
ncbi:MAG: HEAT repeat domain-containing protein [Planctomycetota bacterium]|nr:HEAT repeat domain-containing protein [Planctomycetota bacterium]